MLSRLVITFLSRSKSLLISVTICSGFGAPQNKVCHCFHCFPSISHEVMGPDAIIFVSKVMSPLFNMLFRFVIAFLPRSKHLLISRFQSPSAMILEPKKIKSVTVSIVLRSICHEVIGLDAMVLAYWMLSFKPAFHSPLSSSSRGFLVSLHFQPLEWCYLHYLRLLIFPPAILMPACASIHANISHDVLCI